MYMCAWVCVYAAFSTKQHRVSGHRSNPMCDCPTVCDGNRHMEEPGSTHTQTHTHARTGTSTNTSCIICVLRDFNLVSMTMLPEGGWGKTRPGLPPAPRKSVGTWIFMCVWIWRRCVFCRIRKAHKQELNWSLYWSRLFYVTIHFFQPDLTETSYAVTHT